MPRLMTSRTARRVTVFALICGAAWTIGVGSARAKGVETDVRAGVYTDADAVGFGAGVLTQVSSDRRWFFNPNLEVGFGDRENLIAMNGDFHYDFSQNNSLSVWMGAGPAVLMTDPSEGASRTDVGLDLLTGVGARSGSVRPFGQLKAIVADNSQIVLQGGLRF
jgi:hypothetical protein